MNLYLLEMILKFLRMIFVAFISLFNISLYTENENNINNIMMNVDTYAINTIIIEDDLVKKEEIKKPIVISNNKNTVKKEQTTSNSKNNNQTTNKNTQSSNNKSMTSLAEYTGRLTGYGPDCVGCTGNGNLACKTREKKTFSLVKDGIYYEDKEYGKVRILSAATSKFTCGTIIVVEKEGVEPFTAIVLDTGGTMRKAWEAGNVWMDLAYSSNAMAGSDKLTGSNVKFSVQRWGW